MVPTIFTLLATLIITSTTTTALPATQNTTTTTPSSTPTYNNATPPLPNEDGCFSHAPQPVAIFRDCIGIINQQIAPYPDHTSPLTFSRSSSPKLDIKVPYVRYAENCAIVLDVAQKDGTEHTSMGDVIQTAKGLAVDCVIGAAHQGGEIYIGWGKKLRVSMLGRSAEGGWGDVEGVDGVGFGGAEDGDGKLPVGVQGGEETF